MITKITHSVTKREKNILHSNMKPQKMLFRLFFLVVHQNKKTNFGSSFYLSKTEVGVPRSELAELWGVP